MQNDLDYHWWPRTFSEASMRLARKVSWQSAAACDTDSKHALCFELQLQTLISAPTLMALVSGLPICRSSSPSLLRHPPRSLKGVTSTPESETLSFSRPTRLSGLTPCCSAPSDMSRILALHIIVIIIVPTIMMIIATITMTAATAAAAAAAGECNAS